MAESDGQQVDGLRASGEQLAAARGAATADGRERHGQQGKGQRATAMWGKRNTSMGVRAVEATHVLFGGPSAPRSGLTSVPRRRRACAHPRPHYHLASEGGRTSYQNPARLCPCDRQFSRLGITHGRVGRRLLDFAWARRNGLSSESAADEDLGVPTSPLLGWSARMFIFPLSWCGDVNTRLRASLFVAHGSIRWRLHFSPVTPQALQTLGL